MTAYDPENWHDFAVALLGGAAALTGLLFVAVSLNMDAVLKSTWLTSRAARSLVVLSVVVLITGLVLVPGQSSRTLGIELAVVGVLTWLTVTVRRHGDPAWSDGRYLFALTLFQLATIPTVVAGISLAWGAGGGLYWLVPAIVFAFMAAISNAWILLVEILR